MCLYVFLCVVDFAVYQLSKRGKETTQQTQLQYVFMCIYCLVFNVAISCYATQELIFVYNLTAFDLQYITYYIDLFHLFP